MKKILIILTLLILPYTVQAAFSDTNNHQYQTAIDYIQSQEIVHGYPDGTFQPNKTINRAEFTKILINTKFNLSEIENCQFTKNFPDVPTQEWFAKYVCQAQKSNIIQGYPNGTFQPANNISFVEAAKIINLIYIDTQVEEDAIWYKPHVQSLSSKSAIPTTINSFTHQITRAEIAEIIYRLENNITNLDSNTYETLDGNSTTQTSTTLENCQIFPSDNPWNQDISNLPVHPNSLNFISSIGADKNLHPDFGGNGEYGIPFITVNSTQPKIDINFTAYGDESDPGPYPIPLNAPIEGGSSSDGDRHVIAIDTSDCMLYELYRAFPQSTFWNADSGAIFNLNSNSLRPNYWTSTDAAGLPVFAGLMRYEDIEQGELTHALRFTVRQSQKGFIHPATHFASSSTDPNHPPMGLRLRLKADFDTSQFTGQSKIILEGLKKYGMIVADNGSDWYITGSADTRWNDSDLRQLKSVAGSNFEVVYTGEVIK